MSLSPQLEAGFCLVRLPLNESARVPAMINEYLNRFAKDESGVTLVEYGLIAALIAVAISQAVISIATQNATTVDSVTANLK